MNESSLICRFIKENPEAWESILENEYNIRVKKEGSYAIFNYGYERCNYADPLVQEARGIIIDFKRCEVVCWPFRKFGNHNESYADTIDWESARVLEKVDGSIIKLWFDFEKGEWQFSTNGTIRAENAPAGVDEMGVSFADVIKEADNYSQIPFEALDKSSTYIFELVSQETRVVIKYDQASLYHIGTRSNITGKEYEADIGIKKPQAYALGSLEECIKAANQLNDGAGEEIEGEGFVVVDKDYHRVKVKSPDYLVMNKLTQIKVVSKRSCLEMIISGSADIDIICSANPYLAPVFKYYDFKLSELRMLANKMAILTRGIYKELNQDRGALARVISSHRLAFVGFLSINRTTSGEEILMSMPIDKLVSLIPDYEAEDLRTTLFIKNN